MRSNPRHPGTSLGPHVALRPRWSSSAQEQSPSQVQWQEGAQLGGQLSQLCHLLKASCSDNQDSQTTGVGSCGPGSRNRAGGYWMCPVVPGHACCCGLSLLTCKARAASQSEGHPRGCCRPTASPLSLPSACLLPRWGPCPCCCCGHVVWAPGAEGSICSGPPSGAGGPEAGRSAASCRMGRGWHWGLKRTSVTVLLK